MKIELRLGYRVSTAAEGGGPEGVGEAVEAGEPSLAVGLGLCCDGGAASLGDAAAPPTGVGELDGDGGATDATNVLARGTLATIASRNTPPIAASPPRSGA